MGSPAVNGLLLFLRSQLYLWGSPSSSSSFTAIPLGFTFFFLFVHSYTSGVHLLLLRSQLYLWSSPSSSSSFPALSLGFTFYFFFVPSYISEFTFFVPSYISGFTFFVPSYISGFTFFVPSYISGFTFFFFVPSYISGFAFFFFTPSYISGFISFSASSFPAISVGSPSSSYSSAFPVHLWGTPSSSSPAISLGSPSSSSPAISLGFTFFFCVPSYISGVYILLLRSKLYLWGSLSSSSSSTFPVISLGFTIFNEIFARVIVFFNPTMEVVTFRLRGWCMLGLILLPAFTRRGQGCQDLLSLCDGMHVRLD